MDNLVIIYLSSIYRKYWKWKERKVWFFTFIKLDETPSRLDWLNGWNWLQSNKQRKFNKTKQTTISIASKLDFLLSASERNAGSSEFHFWPTLYTRLTRLLFVVAYTTSHYKYVLLSVCHNSIGWRQTLTGTHGRTYRHFSTTLNSNLWSDILLT